MTNKIFKLFVLILIVSLAVPSVGSGLAAPASISFTILHTNDFHGQLEPSNADATKASNPGIARLANVVNTIRTTKGPANVLLMDAGDEMQGSLLSNLQRGLPTIATFNALGYNVATFGNHEFDWGQTNLADRTAQATYPYVSANIVVNDTSNCATAGWTTPSFIDGGPFQVLTVGTAPNTVKVGVIGVTTTETPIITVATATQNLCFKDPADSILHYYDTLKAQVDVMVVLSHLGYTDGGYGYGIPVYGDQTLATKLNAAGKPVNLIIGGHTHTNLTSATTVGTTKVVQAYYNGRNVGEADITVDTTSGAVTVDWKVLSWKIPNPSATPPTTLFGWYQYPPSTPTFFLDDTKDPTIDAIVTSYANDPAYLALVNTPIGYSAVDLARSNTGDNMMGTFIDDAIYDFLNNDGKPENDVDLFFNNAGGIRTDWCWNGSDWIQSGCVSGTHTPGLLTYGDMFTVLPFGNATVVGKMTGAQILEVVNYGPNVAGVIQPAGLKYKYFSYRDRSRAAAIRLGRIRCMRGE